MTKAKARTFDRRKAFRRAAMLGAPLLAGAALVAISAGQPQAQNRSTDTVLPGYWEYTTRALGQNETERRCVRPSEINRFFGGLSTRRYNCTYPTRQVGNGQALFEGTCVSTGRSQRQLRVRLEGPYTPESFNFRGSVSTRVGGVWTPRVPGSINARRLSATCPANAEYF